MQLQVRRAGPAPDVIAPDGSEVRILCASSRGSMALFTLKPGATSRAVAHRRVEEIWYFIAGSGRFWHADEEQDGVVDVGPGLSLVIPPGTRFQFRCDSAEPLTAVGTTMPPWPGEDEAYEVEGLWVPTV
ncbi:MAG: cupin domain-containing protein [Acetobacteraceae bacterium]|nr:cupin domain-containing protein [Acetobacteraceae bacterium]